MATVSIPARWPDEARESARDVVGALGVCRVLRRQCFATGGARARMEWEIHFAWAQGSRVWLAALLKAARAQGKI